MRNMAKAMKTVTNAGVGRLLTVGVQVRAEGMRETPVNTGNLINSWYGPTPFETPKGPIVEIGLQASYAPSVHEMVDAHFRKPGAKAKFLEDPLKMVKLKDFHFELTKLDVKAVNVKTWWEGML